MFAGVPRIAAMAAVLAMAGLAAVALAGADTTRPAAGLCVECLTVRLGPPRVVRGPFPDELDTTFSALKLEQGGFRGFSANGATYAIDGDEVWEMGGARRVVLGPGPKGGDADCGRWINSVTRGEGVVYALVHQESRCDYRITQTAKSMAIATSRDEGLTWTVEGTVIAGRDAPAAGAITGEGDCTMIDGRDGFLYAYCLRNSDWRVIVARAPVSDPRPGNWRKYHEGGWREDGIGGAATALGFIGKSAALFKDFDAVATVVADPWFGGLRLSLSADKVTFTDLDEPLLPLDGVDWNRPAESALIAYASMLDPEDGTNVVGSDFLLSTVYIPPGETFASRYLVFRDVSLRQEAAPVAVQAGIALDRWRQGDDGIFRTSSGPVVDADYRLEMALGYLLTREPENVVARKLEECVSDRPDRAAYMLTYDGGCALQGFARLRTAGWVYATPEPDTLPLYRCYDPLNRSHFASNAPDCEGEGEMDFLLGYVLER